MPLYRVATAPEDFEGSDVVQESAFLPGHEQPQQQPSTSSSAFSPSSSTARTRISPIKEKPNSPQKVYSPRGPFLVKTQLPPDQNKNTEWFMYPGVWTMYILIILLGWLTTLSIFRCDAGTAWLVVNLLHFVVTFYLFHWKKGSPFAEDQGLYDKLTWWEQLDESRQLTRNRKFLTVVPVVLYLVATYTMPHTDNSNVIILLNTTAVVTLIIAKLPALHQVRIFGINADYPS